jgi:MarR family transcriptional regulator, temperature-dependent positive regulator of motility
MAITPLPPAVTVPLRVKLDYTTLLVDAFNEDAKALASAIYERECGVSLRELRLLRFIASEPGLVLSRLIRLARLEKTLASKAMTQLVRRGLVVRSVGTQDARHVALHLTERGRDVVLLAEPIGRRMEATFLAQLTGAEAAVFQRCLRKLSESHDAVVADIETYLRRRPSSSRGRAAA